MSEIRIENLNKKIKGSVILNDISLTMTPGRIYGLRGKKIIAKCAGFDADDEESPLRAWARKFLDKC